ncbi:MAG: DNA translocase FtsK [Bacteroidota bacterium]|nr:DNA translocase FtsK [Bacteroidota bacterium]
MTKTKKGKSKTPTKKSGNLFQDKRFHVSLGIFLIVLAVIMLLAFFSFLFTWKADQSFTWGNLFQSNEFKAENWLARIGAVFANQFMNKWFGLASFSIPFIVGLFGFSLLKIHLLPFGKSFRYSVILTIWLSVFLSYLFGDANGWLGSGPGGVHGIFMVSWFNNLIGLIGTFFVLSISLFVFLIFTFDNFLPYVKSLPEKTSFIRKRMNNIKKTQPKRITTAKEKPGEDLELNQLEDSTPFSIEISDNEIMQNGNPSQHDNEPIKTEHDDVLFETEQTHIEDDYSEEKNNSRSEADKIENESSPDKVYSEILEELGEYDPKLELSSYKFPSLDLLENHHAENSEVSKEELINNKNKIVDTLGNYKIKIDRIKATIGPTITLYEIVPAPGIRIAKIKNLEDDIALSLAALGIRIIAPIPGKGTIGIEVPNQKPEIVSMRSILSSNRFRESKYELPVALGKTISNDTYIFDLTKMPHILVAGATGQGKSVGLNAIIASLLYKKHPSEIKFVFVDPKKVELSIYSKIEKHYLAKLPDSDDAIITDTKKVVHTLHSLTIEMDNRYNLLKKAQTRNIKEYNNKFIARRLNPENGHQFLPYIVLVVDEFADLIMTAGKEIESPLARIAQLARAVGLHLIIATQRPSTNIITGLIKANFPARIAFRVTSMVDSRTILDTPGANQLIGRGDMLISVGADMVRVQCAFIDTPELEKITEHIFMQQAFPSAHYLPEYIEEGGGEQTDVDLTKRDELFEEAARLMVNHQQGSTSLIQRKFSIGYNRAGRIVDQLEAAGIVGPYEGSKARQVLYPDEYSLEQYLNTLKI